MWLDRYADICGECLDLVAVYEAPDGRIARRALDGVDLQPVAEQLSGVP